MNRRTLPLSQLRAFEAAARHRSFKQAAEELAVTPAAISHQVRELEALLGVALFERRIRQVVPTAEAEHLFPVLRRGFDSFAEALEALREQGNGGSVTLSCTPAFASQWLLPRLADFHARHPDIDLRIHASEAPLDLSRGASLAIRYGMGPYPEHEAEVLANDTFALVASPQLGLAVYEDLKRVRHIDFDWYSPSLGLPSWQHWCQAAGGTAADLGASLTFSEESHAIQAAIAGQGVALLSQTLVKAELERGILQVPFGPRLPGLRYHLIRHSRFAGHAALERVAEWLRGAFAGVASQKSGSVDA
ncbi:LysR substrate-binding domain-containing protein [Billgrantia montanilacus]|uniref:LysR family transcriptional regulator n=1 Tax=Billgrantia montanilacus TaxID=2282305 RepID=A0A368TZK7_9GAMM|nr:LysR substrate-binding domain-containing protein [Halomonas montanilacus]RCV90188.1 LysR family transcriptional regulator [Halomonas montanilacus]